MLRTSLSEDQTVLDEARHALDMATVRRRDALRLALAGAAMAVAPFAHAQSGGTPKPGGAR